MGKKLDFSFIQTLLAVSNAVDESDSEGLDYKWIETKTYKKPKAVAIIAHGLNVKPEKWVK